METHIYKGFKIKEIYQSADGKGNLDYAIGASDIFPHGHVKMRTTLNKVKNFIDLRLLELNLAY